MTLNLHHPKQDHVAARLGREEIVWLGTVRPDGRPHLVPVWFLWDGAAVYIYSQPEAQKVRNLAANPAVTLALQATPDGSDVAILEGVAETVDGAAAPDVRAAYVAKYGAAIVGMDSTPDQMLGAYSTLLRVTPQRLLAW